MSPSEKAKNGGNVASQEPLVPCFQYVRIPANQKEPYEQLTAMLPLNKEGMVPAGDQIPALVKPRFANKNQGFSSEVLKH